MRPAWLEIDLSAIHHNLCEIKRLIGDGVGIIAVVKSNAYGHGAEAVALQALASGADMLAVALVQEGVELREAGIDAPILVLGATDPAEAELFCRHNILAPVSTLLFARALGANAEQRGTPADCHIKLDSGMGRQGVPADEVATFAGAIRDLPMLRVEGVFSHFASSPRDREFTGRQIRTFEAAAAALEQGLGKTIPRKHLANSGAIVRHPEARLDAVRPGALMYGIAAHNDGEHLPTTRQAMTLKARIVATKLIRKGESVGYARTFIAERDTRIAILPIGYADGYPRALTNNAEVLVRGRRCAVVGRVSMDCVVIDISEVPDAKTGEEAVLLGRQGDEIIPTGELAERCDTCVEEIVARMAARLPRVSVGQVA